MRSAPALSATLIDPDGFAPIPGVILANHALATFRNGALIQITLVPMPAPIRPADDMPVYELPASQYSPVGRTELLV